MTNHTPSPALDAAPPCTCEQGDDDCIPCGSPGDATRLCATCLSYADVEES